MNTDTPKTDDSETRVRKNGLSSLIEYCYANDMAKLETELAAASAEMPWYANGESKEQWMQRQREKYQHLENTIKEVTEQRDDLLRYNEAFREESLICADCDAISKEEYDQAIEQRDRLADLVKQFVSILDITEESDSGKLFHPTNITSCRAGDLQKIGELVEALRRASRTTNPNEQ